MQELIAINIVIGDRTYRIKVAPTDEEAVRNTLKTINEQIVAFKTQFSGKDMQDYVAMVLIWYATQPKQALQNSNIDKTVSDALANFEAQIDKAM